MALFNQRFQTDTGGLSRLAQAIERLNRRRDEGRESEYVQQALEGILAGPEDVMASREAQGLPRLGPKKQAFLEGAKAYPKEMLQAALQGVGRKQTQKARLDLEYAKSGIKQQKPPTRGDIADKARAREIIAALKPLASTNPEVRKLLQMGKDVYRGGRMTPEFQSQIATAINPLIEAGGQARDILKASTRTAYEYLDPGESPDPVEQEAIDRARAEATRLAPFTEKMKGDIFGLATKVQQRGGRPVQGDVEPRPQARANVGPRRMASTPGGRRVQHVVQGQDQSYDELQALFIDDPESLLAMAPGSTPEDWADMFNAEFGRVPEPSAGGGIQMQSMAETAKGTGQDAVDMAPYVIPPVAGKIAGTIGTRLAARMAPGVASSLLGTLAPWLGPIGFATTAALGAKDLYGPLIERPIDRFLSKTKMVGPDQPPRALAPNGAIGKNPSLPSESWRRMSGEPPQIPGLSPEEIRLLMEYFNQQGSQAPIR